MDEAPALVDSSQARKKPEPEVDEDGFTKVTHVYDRCLYYSRCNSRSDAEGSYRHRCK